MSSEAQDWLDTESDPDEFTDFEATLAGLMIAINRKDGALVSSFVNELNGQFREETVEFAGLMAQVARQIEEQANEQPQ